MAEKERSEELRWLLQPPAPGTVHIHVDVPEGAELTPEAMTALDALIRALSGPEPEVSGYGTCVLKCGPKYSFRPTCASDLRCPSGYSCKISVTGGFTLM